MTETIFPAGHCARAGKRVISTSTILSLCSETSFGNQDLRRQLLIRRRDEEDLAVETQLSDDRVPRPLLDRDNAAFRPCRRLCDS